MDNDVKTTAELYRLVAWAHAKRKQLIGIGVAVVAIGAIIGIYVWHKNYNETNAAEAFSNLKSPASLDNPTASSADPYIKLADEYQGTGAAARALLTAGGILFDAGKFKEAQGQFEKLLQTYADFPLADQASLGVAACLEAQGKTADAAARYDEFIKRHSGNSALPQAKSALARLYVAQNKPDRALELYTELARANNPDSWSSEAGIQAEELVQKYPGLRKPAATAPSPGMSLGTPTPAPTATTPRK